VATVQRWTGVEVKALRHARRMSLEEFAEHLGVSDRMVSKWEARAKTMQIRPSNQAALDTSLSRSEPEVHARFSTLLAETSTRAPDALGRDEATDGARLPSSETVRHPGDDREMALVGDGVYLAGEEQEPIWLPAFHIDVYPVTNADYEPFVTATGHRPRSTGLAAVHQHMSRTTPWSS
jgi:formylglycine-generating enzyme required for sulfatase activity